MNIQRLLAHVNQFINLSPEEIDLLHTLFIARPFQRGETIVGQGEPARFLAFVNAGYTLTHCTDTAGQEHVIRFAAPGWWSGDLYSLGNEVMTQFTTKGVCEGELLLLPRPAQTVLLERCPQFERYFRQLFQTALLRQQLRFVESHSVAAEQRYLHFQETFPGIEQCISQKHVASYLGITPEFLSKIRKHLAQTRS